METLPPLFWIVVSFPFGLILGSYFNVIIHRVPKGLSVAFPGSHCPHCEHPLAARDNIPLVSYLLLAGKCRYCRAPISKRYPAIELVTGLTSAAVVAAHFFSGRFTDLWHFYAFGYFSLCCVPFIYIDLKDKLLPDALTLPGIVLGVALSLAPGGLTPWQSLRGAVITSGGLLLFAWGIGRLLKKDAMGLGDIKLVAMTGALFGSATAFSGLIYGAYLGALIALPLIALKKIHRSDPIAFGPFICGGTLLAELSGIRFGDLLLKLV